MVISKIGTRSRNMANFAHALQICTTNAILCSTELETPHNKCKHWVKKWTENTNMAFTAYVQ